MSKIIIQIASVSGFLSVAIGAFGAHGLKNILEKNNKVAVFDTAVQYQMFHTVLLLVIGILLLNFESKWLHWSAYSCIVGILIFSGSLYALAITNISKLGMITPIGGLFFLFAWVACLLAAFELT